MKINADDGEARAPAQPSDTKAPELSRGDATALEGAGPDTSAHAAMMDVICPMHAVLDGAGRVVHAGPTLFKLFASQPLIGVRFAELFEIKRPRGDGSMRALMQAAGSKMHLRMRGGPRTDLKGVLVPLADGTGPRDGALVNLSFGISVVSAVRDYGLTGSDFAATDLAVEMLYLVEAKNAAMEASRTLNLRLQGAMIAAEEQAYTDTLTGLRNRRALDYVLDRMSEVEQDFALIHVDLDFFKAVNDTGGHAAGDHVLREVARIMVEETRSDDTVARIGGDEFVLVLKRLTDPARVRDIAARVIERLQQPIEYGGEVYQISASAGSVLSCHYPRPSIALMMEQADAALYAAKNRGRGCHVAFATDMEPS
ncbi:GGDEF domain-containing protein [Roseovarius nanhaiticus]|uniref:Diguanylate cyclase (GGDEF) domain-containing protein n=1 Tax=Roseovarius nanhaiticus TaxID=573024 RepID=A0A1N7FGC1_9RHOB|nr:diguanylate cyclase (GGDEF) domain-containing protein [Roseovarius nanhaiticus]SIR99357.1 diguanylate cyclase (GGDEF) domain-containing protein [Roseovarius nanhaiticus]